MKEILRERSIDAWAFYRHLLNSLVEVYGMEYRPFRYDFGLRYTKADFPADIYNRIEKLCYVAGVHEMRDNLGIIEANFLDVVSKIEVQEKGTKND